MNKIMIIGSSGSGKSYFARRLKEVTNLPLYHLDLIWHKADKTEITKEEFDEKLDVILHKDKWIIDGNYQRTIEKRMIYADTIILFDLDTKLCLDNVLKRMNTIREDMPWVETEVDEEFMEMIAHFKETHLPQIYELIQKYQKDKKVIIFHNYDDEDKFLEGLKKCN